MTAYDLIVIGTGGVGGATAYHAARRGLRVLGLDRFPAGHDRGSSHGETRIIRQAYFEHPDYVPLLRSAYQCWHELESQVGRTLYYPVGLLQIGPADGQVVPGVLRSAAQHGLEVESLTARQVADRFAGFEADESWTGVFEQQAGYLLVEECVRAHLSQAQQLGAELRSGVEVTGWSQAGDAIDVITNQGTFQAARVAVTAGPWAGHMLRDLGLELRVLRKHLYWFATQDDWYVERGGTPTFLYETSVGVFYGFPVRDALGLKAAEHSGGLEVADPLSDPREIDEVDRQRVMQFLSHQLPHVSDQLNRHAVCYYTMSRDENFIVDRHPATPNIVLAAGLSGHGFKFTSVLGEALVELAFDGASRHPISFLRLDR